MVGFEGRATGREGRKSTVGDGTWGGGTVNSDAQRRGPWPHGGNTRKIVLCPCSSVIKP